MILIIQNRIPHYRKALFNRLCKLDDVLVIHSGPITAVEGDQYREVIVPGDGSDHSFFRRMYPS